MTFSSTIDCSIYSFVGDQVRIQSMPDKPDKLKVQGDSDGSLVTPPDVQQQPQSDTHSQQEAANAPVVGGSQGAVGGQQLVEICFKYPDGRTEVISVINAESVHRVAKSEQVIPPLGHSGSFPQTATPRGLDTSSLPDVLTDVATPDVDQPAGDSTQPATASKDVLPTDDPTSGPTKPKRKIKTATRYSSVSTPVVQQQPVVRLQPASARPTPQRTPPSGGTSFSTALVR